MNEQVNKSQFWRYHIAGWSVFVIYNMLMRGYFSHFQTSELVNSGVSGIAMIVVTALLRRPLNGVAKTNSLLVLGLKVLPLTLLAALFIQAIYAVVIVPNQLLFFGYESEHILTSIMLSASNVWFLVLIWTGIYLVTNKQNKIQLIKHDKSEMALSLKSLELELLTSQINPHFIFNAINNIRALILEDGEKSRDMLASLSEVMRYTMLQNDKLIRFEDELFIAEQYLALNQLHFEKRLQLKWKIDQQTLPLKLPRMLLQLLVENAIKHGVGKLREGGVISISTEMTQTHWKIIVSNSGEYNESNISETGVGLKNIKQRLNLVYGDKAHFNIMQKQQLVLAEICIPLVDEKLTDLSTEGVTL